MFSGEPHEGATLIQVPGIWNGHEVDGKKIPGQRLCHLSFEGASQARKIPMAFKFLSMGTAFDLYVNGKEVSSAGIVGMTPETMAPEWLPHVAGFTPASDQMDLLLHVSNFHHRKGGALEVIDFGTEKDIRSNEGKKPGLGPFLVWKHLHHWSLSPGPFSITKKGSGAPLFRCLLSAYCRLWPPLRRAVFCTDLSRHRMGAQGPTHKPHVIYERPCFSLCFIHSLFPYEFKRIFLCALGIPLILLSFVVL